MTNQNNASAGPTPSPPSPQNGYVTPDPNQANLVSGSVNRINIAGKIKHDELMIRVFKWIAYLVCMGLGIWFLITGLCETKSLLNTHIGLMKAQTELIQENSNYYKTINDYTKLQEKETATKPAIPLPPLTTYAATEPVADKIISASAVLTMLAFILGVGLTLMLTLLKFSFTRQEENDGKSELATPLGTLILDLIQAVKEKISK